MTNVLRDYPYLITNILNVCGVLAVAWLVLKPAERTTVVWMGSINALGFPFAGFLEGSYWSPARLGGHSFGVEDLLCGFHLGVVVWLVALLLGRRRLTLPESPRPRPLKLAWVAAFGMVSFLSLWWAGVAAMTSLIAVQAGLIVVLGAANRRMWPVALATGLVYPILYIATVTLYFRIWPAFITEWSLTAPWGVRVLGLPLGEVVWAIEFSVGWPLFAGYLFDVPPRTLRT